MSTNKDLSDITFSPPCGSDAGPTSPPVPVPHQSPRDSCARDFANTLSDLREGRTAARFDCKQMLARVTRSRLHGAAYAYAAVQSSRLGGTPSSYVDALLIGAEDKDSANYYAAPFPRAVTSRADRPLDLLHQIVSKHPRRIAVAIVWSTDFEGCRLPLAVACDSSKATAAWIIDKGNCWPVLARDYGLERVLEHSTSEQTLENGVVEYMMRGLGLGRQDKLDIESSEFRQMFSHISSLQANSINLSFSVAVQCHWARARLDMLQRFGC